MHFTYKESAEVGPKSLCQGDVLKRTPELECLLRDVHHYYLKDENRYFLVLSQSCDLIRRNGDNCKTKYITICAVRSLRAALDREIQNSFINPLEERFRFASEAIETKLFQFCERLLNNNEPNYFYLHSQPDFELSENSCAFLQLSIAVRANLHYDTILNARILSLEDTFQHKLGFLVGNLYSRIGTPDWVPDAGITADEFTQRVQDIIDGCVIRFLPRDAHNRVLNQLKKLLPEEQTEASYNAAVDQAIKIKNYKRDMFLTAFDEILGETSMTPNQIKQSRVRMENHPAFIKAFN